MLRLPDPVEFHDSVEGSRRSPFRGFLGPDPDPDTGVVPEGISELKIVMARVHLVDQILADLLPLGLPGEDEPSQRVNRPGPQTKRRGQSLMLMDGS